MIVWTYTILLKRLRIFLSLQTVFKMKWDRLLGLVISKSKHITYIFYSSTSLKTWQTTREHILFDHINLFRPYARPLLIDQKLFENLNKITIGLGSPLSLF